MIIFYYSDGVSYLINLQTIPGTSSHITPRAPTTSAAPLDEIQLFGQNTVPPRPPLEFATPTTEHRAIPGPVADLTSEPPSLSFREIIPGEDPQLAMDAADNVVEDEGVGDGLGEEDAAPCDGDEIDDEPDLTLESPVPAEQTNTPNRRPLPTWLLGPFKANLEDCKHHSSEGLPPVYASGTFWFPTKDVWCILRDNPLSLPSDLYSPRFFLWDPLAFFDVPCPNCNRCLTRHGEISRPRRCIDSNSTFWIIGYRYRCYTCKHPKSGKNTVTFPSWHKRILANLPRALAAQFPARLSHRSGVSNAVFLWLRSCMQNGMGTKQFSDALRVQHLLEYDRLQLQYLEHIAGRVDESLDKWAGHKYDMFLPFDDNGPTGRHGYVPSSQWFSNMYDSYIEKHQHDFNQHTAMLTCEIGSLDHSHKVTATDSHY